MKREGMWVQCISEKVGEANTTQETLLYFYNISADKQYLLPVELIIKQLCSKGIYDHVEGGIARYTVDDNWIIPHFEKMLYDNIFLHHHHPDLLLNYQNEEKNIPHIL